MVRTLVIEATINVGQVSSSATALSDMSDIANRKEEVCMEHGSAIIMKVGMQDKRKHFVPPYVSNP